MTRWFSKGFVLLIVLAYLVLVGVLYLEANQVYTTATPSQATPVQQQTTQEQQTATVAGIFTNNFIVSIPLVLPFFGLFPFALAWVNAGQVIGYLSLAYGIPPLTYVLYTASVGVLELLAYTILIAENVYIVQLAIREAGAKDRIKRHTWKTVILYLVLLAIAAVVEMAIIG